MCSQLVLVLCTRVLPHLIYRKLTLWRQSRCLLRRRLLYWALYFIQSVEDAQGISGEENLFLGLGQFACCFGYLDFILDFVRDVWLDCVSDVTVPCVLLKSCKSGLMVSQRACSCSSVRVQLFCEVLQTLKKSNAENLKY